MSSHTIFQNSRIALFVDTDGRYVIDQHEEPMPNGGRVEMSEADAVELARALLSALVAKLTYKLNWPTAR